VIGKGEQLGKLQLESETSSIPPLKERLFMKLEFQAKFLQHLNKKKQQDEGFTLIELLVVIIIIGILAAIALPSLLSQVNKGKQAEAKQNVGSINRAQQAYFLEADSFASNVAQVGIGIKTQSVNYNYTITVKSGTNPTTKEKFNEAANNQGLARGSTIKSYLGQNFTAVGDKDTGEVLTLGFVCETVKTGPDGSKAVSSAGFATGTTKSCPDPDKTFKDLSGTKKGT
jgi:type IV pilus assembly protein PilA